MPLTAAEVFRDYVTEGIPASGDHKPRKPEIREMLGGYEAVIGAFTSNGGKVYASRALLFADLAHGANTMAWVIGDATAAFNGVYRKNLGVSLGSWTRVSDLPFQIIPLTNVAGTPNAITATSSLPIPSTSYGAHIIMTPVSDNTGAVTVSVNGGAALPLQDKRGITLQDGDLLAGDMVTFFKVGSVYRLLYERDFAAQAASANASAATAEAAAELAVQAADQAAIEGAGDVPTYGSVTLAIAATIPEARQYVLTMGRASAGDSIRVLWKRADEEPTHPFKFRSTDRYLPDAGGIDAGDGGWWEGRESTLWPQMFGQVGLGGDDSAVFEAWAEACVALSKPWYIPEDEYVLDGVSPIEIRTSGICDGKILIPKDNHACWIEVTRDSAGVVVDTSSWDTLTRGKVDVSAGNAVGKNLWLSSTEVLIERDGSGGSSYLKQEFIRCAYDIDHPGMFTTGLVCTYDDKANLSATAYEPSKPIAIDGLSIVRTGTVSGTETYRGSINVLRDNVTFNDPSIINDEPDDPIAVAVEVSICADVVINRPKITGYDYPGLGYGIIGGTTIGLVINDAHIPNARHAFTGRHNVDVNINRGVFGYQIDDHWGDRMIVRDAVVYCKPGLGAIEYAGNDITIENLKQFGGRSTLGIRVDTPHLGGKVVIKNSTIDTRGESGFFYVFGFSSSGGPNPAATWTTTPSLPDEVIIEDAKVTSSTTATYCAYLGQFTSTHINWGSIIVRGKCTFNNTGNGIFAHKNATYQTGRASKFIVDGDIDFNTGLAVYVVADDAVATRGADIRVRNARNTSLRFSPYGANTVFGYNAELKNIDIDDGSEPFGSALYRFHGCTFTGGGISVSRNIGFFGCVISGVMTNMPDNTYGTYVGNAKAGGSGSIPANITNNVVSPSSV